MSTNDFVCMVIGMYGRWIDKITEEFDIDFDDEDVRWAIRDSDPKNPKSIGLSITKMVINKLAQHFSEAYPTFDEEKFDWYINGEYSHIYYDGEEICCENDMQDVITHQDEDETE